MSFINSIFFARLSLALTLFCSLCTSIASQLKPDLFHFAGNWKLISCDPVSSSAAYHYVGYSGYRQLPYPTLETGLFGGSTQVKYTDGRMLTYKISVDSSKIFRATMYAIGDVNDDGGGTIGHLIKLECQLGDTCNISSSGKLTNKRKGSKWTTVKSATKTFTLPSQNILVIEEKMNFRNVSVSAGFESGSCTYKRVN